MLFIKRNGLDKKMPTCARISFGCSVKLWNQSNIKATNEFRPNLWSQSDSVHQTNSMFSIFGTRRSGQKIPTHLSNILCHLISHTIFKMRYIYIYILSFMNKFTVQSYWMQSAQKLVALNFLRRATVQPLTTAAPIPIIPPVEWYKGRQT